MSREQAITGTRVSTNTGVPPRLSGSDLLCRQPQQLRQGLVGVVAERAAGVGLIAWGSAGGAIIGPKLMAPALAAGTALGIDPAASAFLISVAGYAFASLLIELFLRPIPWRSRYSSSATPTPDGPSPPPALYPPTNALR